MFDLVSESRSRAFSHLTKAVQLQIHIADIRRKTCKSQSVPFSRHKALLRTKNDWAQSHKVKLNTYQLKGGCETFTFQMRIVTFLLDSEA